MSEAGLSATAIELSPVLVLIGVGSGLVVPLIVAGVLQSVPGTSAGAASGVLTTTQQFSITLGISAVGTLFFAKLASAGMVAAMQAGLIADLALVSLALVMTLLPAAQMPRPCRCRRWGARRQRDAAAPPGGSCRWRSSGTRSG